jgi:hypothetical protein
MAFFVCAAKVLSFGEDVFSGITPCRMELYLIGNVKVTTTPLLRGGAPGCEVAGVCLPAFGLTHPSTPLKRGIAWGHRFKTRLPSLNTYFGEDLGEAKMPGGR